MKSFLSFARGGGPPKALGGQKLGPARLLAPGPPRYATRGNLVVTGKRGKPRQLQSAMPDSSAIHAERPVQRTFRKNTWFQILALATAVLLFGRWVSRLPDRAELGPRITDVMFERANLDPRGFAPLRLAGAWTLTSSDPRLGGVSALAVEGADLVGLSDSGVIIRFPQPSTGTARAWIREVPGGLGNPNRKSYRDSESLLRDPFGRGWWAGFENFNQVWLYDRLFSRALGRIDFGRKRWPWNRGLEAMSTEGRALLLFPESGDEVVEVRGSSMRTLSIENPAGRISDAARLPSGELLVVNRRLTALGFANSIAVLKPTRTGFRYRERIKLGVSALDNVEALAPERLPDGQIRLWLMTDDNFQRPLRTLLIALDWPKPPARRPS